MYVYSGNSRKGTVGAATPFRDCKGEPLFVGDIVCVFTDGYVPDGLTAVVSDEFTSYSDGTHVINEGAAEQFVMGIKSVDLENPNTWRVVKLKDYRDVIDGEHWRAYGFNYRID